MNGKWFGKSKTLWFNGIAFVLVIAGYYGFKTFEPAPEVKVVADAIMALVTVLLPLASPIINIVLRVVTKGPVKLKR